MLPEERRQYILRYLREHGSAHISELRKLLGVSEMTIHRDLQHLASQGYVARVRGGAMLIQAPPRHEDACVVCGIRSPQRTQVLFLHQDGSREVTCCAHCASVHAPRLLDTQVTILARDFLFGHMVEAHAAYFVVNPVISVCCRPAVFAFETEEIAQRFVRGFEGQVVPWTEVQRALAANHR